MPVMPLDASVMAAVDTSQQATGDAGTAPPTPSGSRSGTRWFVVATYAHAEERAETNLRDQGYEAFLPLITVRRCHHHVVRIVDRPLFPGYLFTRFDAQREPWRPITNTPGVYDLIRNRATGMPEAVANGATEALQAIQALAATQPQETIQWAPGAAVAVANGAFQGHPAVVVEVEPKTNTVAIAIMAFGTLHRVTLKADRLVARD
jgi:transcriptional antiterminator RfaH